jgi:hypothetical protein
MTVITTNLFHLPIWAQASQLVPISSGDRRRWGLGGTAALPTPHGEIHGVEVERQPALPRIRLELAAILACSERVAN